MVKKCAVCQKELSSGMIVHPECLKPKKALSTDKRFIYICSPVRSDPVNNIEKARGYCKWVMDKGYIPIAPHVMFDDMLHDDIPDERLKALEIGLQLLRMCDELWYFGTTISEGMRNEIEHAESIGISISHVIYMQIQAEGVEGTDPWIQALR